MKTVIFRGYKGSVRIGKYSDGSPCIQLFTTSGEPLARATVCLADYGLTPDPGFCYIKDYAENRGILDSLIDAGVVEPIGQTVQFGLFDACAHVVKLVN